MTSPAKNIADVIWNGCLDYMNMNDHSWRKLNDAMREAVSLSIRAGLTFDRDDFQTFEETYRMSHWGHSGDGYEHFYCLAVESKNASACKSFEAFKQREPFMLDDQRIYVGRKFTWNEEKVECTSFPSDKHYVIACSYPDSTSHPRKIKHHYRISQDDLRKARKAKKEKQITV